MTAPRPSAAAFLASIALAAGLCPAAAAQLGSVDAHQKLSPGTGGFFGALNDDDEFGFSMGALGDLDGDGVTDLAVGAPWDDDGGTDRGAVWILFLNADGTVKAQQKISDTAGGFTGALFDADGTAVVVHANAADHFADPTGNSGGRIACGVIQKVSQP